MVSTTSYPLSRAPRSQHPHPLLRPFRWLSTIPSTLFRPSVRLKTTLYLLVLGIVLLVLLALNAFHTTTALAFPADSVLNTKPSHDSPADSGEGKHVAQGKDAHLVDEEIQRSFEEPDFALLSGKQPSQIGCNVPLEGEDGGVLVFLGVFSAADKKDRRDL
jgi:hypothetical protein